jgi:flagellar basal-body rod modification protein FlgD
MVTGNIVNGVLQTGTTATDQSEKSSGSNLGKDAFLQLLVTQLQYQDPLNPQDNSEMVSQLAQFSALEEMQNVSSSITNSQALSLVGKNVIIEVGKSSGADTTTTVGGYVQYVQIVDGSAKLSINDKLYDYADFDTVVDDDYLESILKPDTNTGTTTDDKTDTDDKTTTDDKTDTDSKA